MDDLPPKDDEFWKLPTLPPIDLGLTLISLLALAYVFIFNPGGGSVVYYSLPWWQTPGILLLVTISILALNCVLRSKTKSSFARLISLIIILASLGVGLYVVFGMVQYGGNHFG
jgi:hypothetical protein